MVHDHRLERRQVLPKPRAEVFAFFADATNLERITPTFLNFRITTPRPIVLGAGSLIDYRLRLYGIPFHWRTRIDSFEPNHSFSDSQLVGPYRAWHHTHAFVDVPGGTEMRDTVDYQLALGPLGDLAHRLFVARALERIFDHRARVIGEIFGP